MAYVQPGIEYYVTKTSAEIADLEEQLRLHRVDDPELRAKVFKSGTDVTSAIVDHLETRLRSRRARLQQLELAKAKRAGK